LGIEDLSLGLEEEDDDVRRVEMADHEVPKFWPVKVAEFAVIRMRSDSKDCGLRLTFRDWS
jgi:hypothetical protein